MFTVDSASPLFQMDTPHVALPKRPYYAGKVDCMCFSAINGSGPAYLSELLPVYTPSRTLRSSSDTCVLKIQR